jgi:hypothetical protein
LEQAARAAIDTAANRRRVFLITRSSRFDHAPVINGSRFREVRKSVPDGAQSSSSS